MAAKKTSTPAGPATKRRTARQPRKAVVTLPQNARIGQAAALKSKLQKALEKGTPVEVDASKVEKIDTSVMQLLTAFCMRAEAESVEIKWRKPAETVHQAAALLGLERFLKLPAGAAESVELGDRVTLCDTLEGDAREWRHARRGRRRGRARPRPGRHTATGRRSRTSRRGDQYGRDRR
jgi:anti-anti-sigma regulatory factor